MNSASTPMLKQYQTIKSNYKDFILFFRLGDFYEMFYQDAKVAAKILDLVLTSRNAGNSEKAPMCGIPYHAADTYISRLIKANCKIAICEQVEDPSTAKGVVKREVVRTITQGTYIDENTHSPRYLLSLTFAKNNIGIAFTDTTSGAISVNEYSDFKKAIDVISRLPVYECIFACGEKENTEKIFNHPLLKSKKISLTEYQDWCFNTDIARNALNEHFGTATLKGFGIQDKLQGLASAGALLEYLKDTHKQPLEHIDKLSLYTDSEYAFISPSAVYGLELDNLIESIDNTFTGMGKRKLHYWFYHPLKEASLILKRQHAVKALSKEKDTQKEFSSILKKIPDIEKSFSRISCGYSKVKDILAIRNTLTYIPQIQETLSLLVGSNSLFSVLDIPDIRELLEKAVNPDIPLAKPQGKIIKEGFNKEIDNLRDIEKNGKKWLRSLQEKEIKRTGMNSLKIGFNKIFGYYLEVTRTNLDKVPSDWIRKQTLVNAERFITPELKEFEENMLQATEKINTLETEIITGLTKRILQRSEALHYLSNTIATLDVINSLSILALLPGYIAPQISDEEKIDISQGRHPVVEKNIDSTFIPNDTLLDCQENHLLTITGPNMSGKSTYIRQVAILVIMAQTGSFIPAERAHIGIADKIFTRIGAHDEITKGQSTFMVEMNETAHILNNLSKKSLVILDEIGRGTSTYDGLSLAWAVGEHLQEKKVRTLFATHFHELITLAQDNTGTKNYNVQVKEWNDEIVFLHKIIPGSTDDSYGIYVAKLAGVPKKVLKRAKHILMQLELHGSINKSSHTQSQLSFFNQKEQIEKSEIEEQIESLEIDSLTPIQALNKIVEWKDKLSK